MKREEIIVSLWDQAPCAQLLCVCQAPGWARGDLQFKLASVAESDEFQAYGNQRKWAALTRLFSTPTGELMKELKEASRERKQAVLVEVLRRSPQAQAGNPVLEQIIDKLERCGRTHSGKYSRNGLKRPGTSRCKLPFCPRCQGRKRKAAQARSVALVRAAAGPHPDHEEVFLAHIDARKGQSIKGFRKDLARAVRELGFKLTGPIQVGLYGGVHCHVTVIAPQGLHRLWDQLREITLPSGIKLFPHVKLELIEQAHVFEGVEGITGYGLDPVHGRDARDTARWNPRGIADWVLASHRHTGSRKLELGFTRGERTSARPVKLKRKSKLGSILLTKLRLDRFNAWKQSSAVSPSEDAFDLHPVLESDLVGSLSNQSNLVGPKNYGELHGTDSPTVDDPWKSVGENTTVHHEVSEKGNTGVVRNSSLQIRLAKLMPPPSLEKHQSVGRPKLARRGGGSSRSTCA